MTPDPTPPKPDDPLQFDRVSTGKPGDAPPGGAVICSSCKKPIADVYYHIGGKPICASCREKAVNEISAWQARGRGGSAAFRAVVYGVGAMVAGAFIYWAVMAYLNLEIGIVAILIGWMVGYMIRKATHNLGGRRYQILAVSLTYLAVGLAYTPFAFQEIMKGKGSGAQLQTSHRTKKDTVMNGKTMIIVDSSALLKDSTPVVAETDSSETPDSLAAAPAATKKTPSLFFAFGALALLIVALPVIGIIGSMPSGLISALIIGFGLRTAWRMTGEAKIDIRGPFRVGAQPAPAK